MRTELLDIPGPSSGASCLRELIPGNVVLGVKKAPQTHIPELATKKTRVDEHTAEAILRCSPRSHVRIIW